MDRNVDHDPEYVRDRIDETKDLGRKFLVSLGLCAILVASIGGEFRDSDDHPEPSPVFGYAIKQTSLQPEAVQICSNENSTTSRSVWHPLKHKLHAIL